MARTKPAALMALALCAAASEPALARGRQPKNPTISSVNQPVVQQTHYLFDVRAGSGRVDAGELGRLADWFETLQLGYGDRISVDTGSYDDERVRSDIGRVAADYGLLLSEGAPITAGAVQPGSARVIVSRAEAFVPGCPNWAYSGQIGAPITTDSNYGCAQNSNLAAMVADANDLVLGQARGESSDSTTASKAIKVYREAPPTGTLGLKDTITRGGK